MRAPPTQPRNMCYDPLELEREMTQELREYDALPGDPRVAASTLINELLPSRSSLVSKGTPTRVHITA